MKLKTTIFKIISVFLSFNFAFFLSEIAYRYKYHGFDGYLLDQEMFKIKNWNDHNVRNVFKQKWPVKLDSDLGWKSNPGDYTKNNPWNVIVNIDENGFRSNGKINKINNEERIIVFVGDSFVFGDGVNDNETIPSFYQKLKEDKIVNAGVSGYGIDQIYLTAVNLIDYLNVSEIFLCFIANDINRTEYSIWCGAEKPFFKLENNKLKYVGINGNIESNSRVNFFQKYGGYSFLLHTLMMNFCKEYWLKPSSIGFKSEHKEGLSVSIKLLNQLKNICDKRNVDLHLVPLMTGGKFEDEKKILELLGAVNRKFSIIDVYAELKKIKHKDLELWKSYFLDDELHLSKKGNNYVSNYIFSR